jgi:hypothetical protein
MIYYLDDDGLMTGMRSRGVNSSMDCWLWDNGPLKWGLTKYRLPDLDVDQCPATCHNIVLRVYDEWDCCVLLMISVLN